LVKKGVRFKEFLLLPTGKGMKVILLGATFATGNMGVGALTAGSIRAAREFHPGAEVFLLDYGKEPAVYEHKNMNGSCQVPLLNMRFSKKIYLPNNITLLLLLTCLIKAVPGKELRRKIARRNFYLGHILDADIAASIAGGDSFSDIYGPGRLLYESLPQVLVLLTGQKLVLLPQTVGPFKRPSARMIARYILKKASLIYLRDHLSKEEIKGLLGNDFNEGEVRFCYDVGFALDPLKPPRMDLGGLEKEEKADPRTAGVNISGLLYMGGYTQNNMFDLMVDYRRLVQDIIADLIERKSLRVLLVPHVFGEGANSESDSTVCENVYRELKPRFRDRIYLTRGRYNQNEIKYIIGLCGFFIGSRMHACIAALSQNIPTVPIAYSKKFKGVMETIGVDEYVADPRTMEQGEIMAVIEKAYGEREQIKTHLERKMPEVRTKVLNLFKEIAEELKVN
jgi:polysaccharide pyruvyl transferase WcaK-like protein